MPVVVTAYALLLNAAADPADVVQLEGKLSDTPDVGGKVADYGGGRMRWVQDETVMRKVPLALDSVTPAQLAWLEAHKGTPGVWLRDPFGRRYFGVYGTFTATPYDAGAGGYHVVSGLAFQQLTRYESV